MRKLVFVFISVLLFFSGTALFAEGKADTSDKTVLTYVYWGSPAEDKAIKNALSAFEGAHPGITVEPMYLPGDLDGSTYNAKMKALAASGKLPDVGYFRPEEFGNYAEKDFFLKLDDLIARDNMDKTYIPQTWLKIEGNTYGAYTAAECQVMWYNKDVLKEAGVPLPPTDYTKAWTWDQFVDYLKMITIDTNGKHPGESGFDSGNVARYGVSYDLWSAMYYPSVWSNGGGIISEDGKSVLLDKPETIEAFQNISDLMNVYNVMPLMSGGTNISPSIMMANKQLGFWVTGQWTLLELGAMKNLNLGVAALPIMKKPAQIYLSGVNVVFNSSKNPEEAWELQKWMMNPEKTLDLYTSGLWMPTKESFYSSEADLAKWLDNDVHPEGYREAVVNSMKISVNEPIKIRNINQIWGDYLNAAVESIWIGKSSAKDALTEAAEKIRKSGLLQGTY
ncbi:sugar ABC transporter substrate-binding protein [Oceanispirochaeta sp.]|jgi:multiple sugar transport system substrate-binding protein|uniref:ABC transporter substrate-binding protein n=1 Tax=Oceanispirochaeta sp. TaxID=2035350 RepID=UPI002626590A|nr:sugar ABC transporter substrate-binding protein [Oceanispirochaeta sp.]MDA3958284.1 sugar ABC transporter substrate-binding protein [Oceanispirochaeta sp.]